MKRIVARIIIARIPSQSVIASIIFHLYTSFAGNMEGYTYTI